MNDEELQDLHDKTGISKRTLEMIDRSMESLEEGNVSGPVDIEEDFPFLTDSECDQ